MEPTLHIDVTICDQNAEEDLRKIIPKLRPEWKDEDVEFKVSPRDIKAGVLNLMIACFCSADMQNGIMFRIRRNEKSTVIEYLNRDNEVKNIVSMRKVHGFDFIPNVLAVFKNGFCYDYVVGRVMTPQTVRLDCNWRTIAKQLALLHSMELPEDQNQSKVKYSEYIHNVEYPDKLEDAERNERFLKYLPTKDYVVRECKEIVDHVETLKCKSVLSHNDARSENMVWNEKTGKITFVDWESAGMNNQPFDIAYHFRNYAGYEDNDFSLYPDKQFQMQWIRIYLESYYSKVNPKHVVSEADLEKLYVQTQYIYLLFLIECVTWVGLMKEFEQFPFDVLEICIRSYDEYRRVKDEILALKLPDDK